MSKSRAGRNKMERSKLTGGQLKKLREDAGLDLRELANRLGLKSISGLNSLEHGRLPLTLSMERRIRLALGQTPAKVARTTKRPTEPAYTMATVIGQAREQIRKQLGLPDSTVIRISVEL